MTAKIVTARRFVSGVLRFAIWLDITKFEADGVTPAERWMLRRDYPIAYEAGRQAAALNAIKAELLIAAAQQIAVLQDQDAGGTALAIEGQTF